MQNHSNSCLSFFKFHLTEVKIGPRTWRTLREDWCQTAPLARRQEKKDMEKDRIPDKKSYLQGNICSQRRNMVTWTEFQMCVECHCEPPICHIPYAINYLLINSMLLAHKGQILSVCISPESNNTWPKGCYLNLNQWFEN